MNYESLQQATEIKARFLTKPFSAILTIIVGLQPMRLNKINRFLLIVCCTGFVFANRAAAQKTYFVYLQNENQQPFYVNISGRNISSSSIGYLILSRLTDSTYPVKIGFPGMDATQDFYVPVKGNDVGYLIKNFGEKGYGLFNLQSMEVVMNSNGEKQQKDMLAAAAISAANEQRIADSLGVIAARRVAINRQQDSADQALAAMQTIKQDTTTVAITEVPAKAAEVENTTKKETNTGAIVAPVVVGTVAAAAVIPAVITGNKKEELEAPAALPVLITPAASTVIPASIPVSKPAGKDSTIFTKQLVYLDAGEKEQEKAVIEKSILSPSDTSKPVLLPEKTGIAVAATVAVTKPVDREGDPKFLDMEMTADTAGNTTINPPSKTETAVLPVATEAAGSKAEVTNGVVSNNSNAVVVPLAVSIPNSQPAAVSNNCKQEANEKDFFALRKKMVSTDGNDEMIGVAKKVFKEKCFSLDQVRNLCVLFLDDQGRYDFLDEAYSHTTNPANYKQLGDLLKDGYFIRRFNAMLR